jgi:hypothetical protein
MTDSSNEKGGLGQIVESLAKPLGQLLTTGIPIVITTGVFLLLALSWVHASPLTTLPIFPLLLVLYCMVWYVGQKALDLYRQLPQNFLEFGIGFIFCFFGGVYPTLFAAVQAAENGGRTAVLDALYDLAQEATVIIEESKKDDNADNDKDGKKDVTEASNKEYWQHKTLLVLRKMNPEKVSRVTPKSLSLHLYSYNTIMTAVSQNSYCYAPSYFKSKMSPVAEFCTI